LTYSYLLIPFTFLFSPRKRDKLFISIALYGLIFFFFITFYFDIPKVFKPFRQPLYTYLEYSFLTGIILFHLQEKRIKTLIKINSIAFLVFLIVYNILTKRQRIDSVPIGIETILIIIYSFFFFQQFLKSNISKNVYEYPSFWLVVGLLIYLGCNFFFNILFNHISNEQIESFWHLTYIPEIIKNFLFSMVILGLPSYNNELENSINRNHKTDIPNLDMI
jgi:hypothetical protein